MRAPPKVCASARREPHKTEIDPEEMRLIEKLIEERLKPWGRQMVHDPVQERLKEIIASTKKPRPPKRPAR